VQLKGDGILDMFLNLRAEKQEHIINAALNVFGKNGYKKASVADIAVEAGIAKGMINYYFGSKKNLYLYLIELCFKTMSKEMDKRFGSEPLANNPDFFEKMKVTIAIKVDMIKEYPAILSFLASVYAEKDSDVAEEIFGLLAEGMKFRERWLYDGVDVSRFKDDIDHKLVDKFLVWAAEGFTNSLRNGLDIDAIGLLTKELFDFLDIMQKHFYKGD